MTLRFMKLWKLHEHIIIVDWKQYNFIMLKLMQCCCIDKLLKHLQRTGTKFARPKIYFRGDLVLGSRPYLFKHLKLYNTAKFHTGIIKRTIVLIPTPLE